MGEPMIDLPINQIAEVCRRYQVKELAVFGSALRDSFDAERSDVDFLVEFGPEAHVGFIKFSQLEMALSEVLQRNIDLVSKRGLNPRIRDEILSNARVVYEAA